MGAAHTFRWFFLGERIVSKVWLSDYSGFPQNSEMNYECTSKLTIEFGFPAVIAPQIASAA